MVKHSSTFKIGCVLGKTTVVQGGIGIIIVYSTAIAVDRVFGVGAVCNNGTRVVVRHPSTITTGRIS